MRRVIFFLCGLAGPLIILPGVAHAYVGPGLGAGTIAVILGVIGSIFLALFAVVWYPFKRILKRNKKNENQSPRERDPSDTDKTPKTEPQ